MSLDARYRWRLAVAIGVPAHYRTGYASALWSRTR